MFSVTITSNCAGLRMSCIAELSTSWSTSSTSEYSAACRRWTTSRHSRLDSSTLALSTLCTLLPRVRAASKAIRAMRSISYSLYAIVSYARIPAPPPVAAPATPVSRARSPKYSPPVSSRTMSMSTPSRNSGLSVRRVTQRAEDLDRSQVRVEPERLANAEKPLLGPRLCRVGRVPLGSADRREQNRVSAVRRLECRLRQRRPGRVDRGPAEKSLGELEAHPVPRADDVEDLDRLGGDLGADAVARQQADSIQWSCVLQTCCERSP